jgi:hypothetical protein
MDHVLIRIYDLTHSLYIFLSSNSEKTAISMKKYLMKNCMHGGQVLEPTAQNDTLCESLDCLTQPMPFD